MRQCLGDGAGQADDSVSGAAERRIDAQDDLTRTVGSPHRGHRDNRPRRLAVDPVFHLLELAQGDSHAEILPAAAKLQKQKRWINARSCLCRSDWNGRNFPGRLRRPGNCRHNLVEAIAMAPEGCSSAVKNTARHNATTAVAARVVVAGEPWPVDNPTGRC